MTAVLRFLLLALAVLPAATTPAKAVDLDKLTVVTLARDGSWGVATAGSQGQAIAVATRDCRVKSPPPSDCGAQFTTVRGGWVVASLCGDHKIIVAAETREAAEQAALSRELQLKGSYTPDQPPCRRVLTINPCGAVVTTRVEDAGLTRQVTRRRALERRRVRLTPCRA